MASLKVVARERVGLKKGRVARSWWEIFSGKK
jgi:hypothetical protein